MKFRELMAMLSGWVSCALLHFVFLEGWNGFIWTLRPLSLYMWTASSTFFQRYLTFICFPLTWNRTGEDSPRSSLQKLLLILSFFPPSFHFLLFAFSCSYHSLQRPAFVYSTTKPTPSLQKCVQINIRPHSLVIAQTKHSSHISN